MYNDNFSSQKFKQKKNKKKQQQQKTTKNCNLKNKAVKIELQINSFQNLFDDEIEKRGKKDVASFRKGLKNLGIKANLKF